MPTDSPELIDLGTGQEGDGVPEVDGAETGSHSLRTAGPARPLVLGGDGGLNNGRVSCAVGVTGSV